MKHKLYLYSCNILVILAGLSQNIYAVCIANNAFSYKSCITQVNTGQTDQIEIVGQINCSGYKSCEGFLSDIHRPVQIYGRANTNPGFKRLDTFNYSIISLYNADDVTILDLSFDENSAVPYPANEPNIDPNYTTPITVSLSSNILIDNISVDYAKIHSIDVYKSNTITIRNSAFRNSGIFGVRFADGNDSYSTNIRVENNKFTDNRSNALLYSGFNGVISGNIFKHNHHDAIWHSCGPVGKDACPGGQLLIESPSQNLEVSGNEIAYGNIDDNSGAQNHASGIEFSAHDMVNITIFGNEIHDNTGTGIYMNPNPSNVSGITILGNRITNNGLQAINFPLAISAYNCFSWNCAAAKINATPNPCVIAPGQNNCSANISWDTANAPNACVFLRDTPFSCQQRSDGTNAPWINANGVVLDLRAENNSHSALLGRTYVRGVAANQQPIGALDIITAEGIVAGWALDPDAVTQNIAVHLYIDGPAGTGTFLGAVTANLSRPDLNQAGYAGNHGYNFLIPAGYHDGRAHQVYAYAIDTAGGVNPLLDGSPKSFLFNLN